MWQKLNGWKMPLISFLSTCLVGIAGAIILALSTKLDNMAALQRQQGEQVAQMKGQVEELKTLVQVVIQKL